MRVNPMKKYISLFLPALLLLSVTFVFAAQTPISSAPRRDRSKLPIVIKSAHLWTDNKNKVAIFTVNVVSKQDDVTIFSDKLTVYYADNNEVDKIEADGNVRIIQGNRVGLGSHGVYESKQGKITLTGGKPRVMQGTDTTTGKVITYFLDDEQSVVTGDSSEPVVTTIHPKPRKGNEAPR